VTKQFPQEFRYELDRLLGDQAPHFWKSVIDDPPISGLRVNTLKTETEYIKEQFPESLEPLSWAESGFQVINNANFSKHPFHSAGLYYLQEPSAMAPVSILDPQPGEWILDLCAAPGGKTTQILSMLKNQGVLMANDPNPKRIQALTRNIDRWGARNVIITCETPQKLANRFGPVFDKVLVDGPCSGEGTFRSSPRETRRWSPSFSQRCASIQDEILWQAGKLIRPGGVLVYSTCTFNHLENEGSVSRFLEKNPEYEIDPIPSSPGLSTGILTGETDPFELRSTVRIWPHLAPGEGHYIARMVKKNGETNGKRSIDRHGSEWDSEKKDLYREFYEKTLKQTPGTTSINPDDHSLVCQGFQLYWVPQNSPSPHGLNVRRWGWLLGEFKTDRFIPSHTLASSLSGKDVQMVLEFSIGDSDLNAYLRGSQTTHSDRHADKNWFLVTVEGFSLGWGFFNQGRIKSFLPGWLRSN
jgi:NOL1/NOP2/sun family putative RNA methylase